MRQKKPHIYREQDAAGFWSWTYNPGWHLIWNHQALGLICKMNWGWRPGRKWR